MDYFLMKTLCGNEIKVNQVVDSGHKHNKTGNRNRNGYWGQEQELGNWDRYGEQGQVLELGKRNQEHLTGK